MVGTTRKRVAVVLPRVATTGHGEPFPCPCPYPADAVTLADLGIVKIGETSPRFQLVIRMLIGSMLQGYLDPCYDLHMVGEKLSMQKIQLHQR
jgi:hypothetical protein